MIKVLEKQVADRIAAGEVVDRPVSIVKELVENAIDAGATSILVEIRKGGKAYIRVTDDGCGIPPEEAETAFLRHATSKISSEADLSSIETLGFRGEALASIAAVSRVELLTKCRGSKTGLRLLLDEGNVVAREKTGCPDGTTIIVTDLFYHTPARLKFMKSDAAESSLIIEFLSQMALAYSRIRFRALRGGQVVFATKGDGNRLGVIARVYPQVDTERLTAVEAQEGALHLTGYISAPDLSLTNAGGQLFFVNGRVVRSKVLERGLMEGYRERLFAGRHPLCYLFLHVDPKDLDVNIHPNKREVRFEREGEVADFVARAVAQALGSGEAMPSGASLLAERMRGYGIGVGEDGRMTGSAGRAGSAGTAGRGRRGGSHGKESGAGWTAGVGSAERAGQTEDVENTGRYEGTGRNTEAGRPVGADRTEGAGWPDGVGGPEGAGNADGIGPHDGMGHTEWAEGAELPSREGKIGPGAPCGGAPAGGWEEKATDTVGGGSVSARSLKNQTQIDIKSFLSTYEDPTGLDLPPWDGVESAPENQPSPSNSGRVTGATARMGATTQTDGMTQMSGAAQTAGMAEPDPTAIPIEAPAIRPFDFSALRLIGAIFDTYMLAVDGDAFYIIDQHAAHERVFYERLLTAYNSAEKVRQPILTPLLIPVSLSRMEDDAPWLTALRRMGYSIDPFGPGTCRITEIPDGMSMTEAETFAIRFVEEGASQRDLSNRVIVRKLITRACKEAVKGGDKLSMPEMQALLRDLSACRNPFSCPHGRPTFVRLRRYDLERLFKRVD